MTDDRDRPAIQFTPEVIAALERAVRDGAVRLPPPPPSDVPSGIDAATIRKAVVTMIDEELSRRRVLSDTEIRTIAKEVARGVYNEAIKPVEEELRSFLTEAEIEAIVIKKLRDIGLRADGEHADDTRQTIESLMRGLKMRAKVGGSLLEETAKAILQQIIGGGIIGAILYAALKGGAHP